MLQVWGLNHFSWFKLAKMQPDGASGSAVVERLSEVNHSELPSCPWTKFQIQMWWSALLRQACLGDKWNGCMTSPPPPALFNPSKQLLTRSPSGMQRETSDCVAPHGAKLLLAPWSCPGSGQSFKQQLSPYRRLVSLPVIGCQFCGGSFLEFMDILLVKF